MVIGDDRGWWWMMIYLHTLVFFCKKICLRVAQLRKKTMGILQNNLLWYIYINMKRITKKRKNNNGKKYKGNVTVQSGFELPTCWLQGEHHNHCTMEIRHKRSRQMVICYWEGLVKLSKKFDFSEFHMRWCLY